MTLLGMRSFHRWCQLILYGRFQLIELDNDEVQQKILANCFLNWLQIWRGRHWITVFCRLRHKKWQAKGETLQRAVFWSKLFCMRTNSTTILRIFQSGSVSPSCCWFKFLAYYLALHFYKWSMREDTRIYT